MTKTMSFIAIIHWFENGYYICFNHDEVMELFTIFRNGGPSSLQMAKFNIDKYFLVVGFLEDIPNFYSALEKLLPLYFEGLEELSHIGR